MMHPSKNYTKCLISTPAEIVGEYESDKILITHAFPELMKPNPNFKEFRPGPTHRRFLIASFETKEVLDNDKELPRLSNHHWIGDFFAVCLSIFLANGLIIMDY